MRWNLIESIHRAGSRIRHSHTLERREWIWAALTPIWQKAFHSLVRNRGYSTKINGDSFKLNYTFASYFDRVDRREYESAFYRAFVDRVHSDMTVIDIGAHIGLYSLGAAKRIGDAGMVYAFEPSPVSAAYLTEHIALNGQIGRIELHQVAVTDWNGQVPFYARGYAEQASLERANLEELAPDSENARLREMVVQTVSLDTFCSERGLVPGVIKIDAEGSEEQILVGARELLTSLRPEILLEIHPVQMANCGSTLESLSIYLHSVGYLQQRIDEPNRIGVYHAVLSAE